MSVTIEELIDIASSSNEESVHLDFKREYCPEKKAAFWAETVKDIVAFANTKGGAIIFGVEDDGSDSTIDCTLLFDLDPAILADQIRKYTNFDFRKIAVYPINRNGKVYPAILILPVDIPIVFTKVGTYEYEAGKQKTAFSLGTIYFRHGAKSEPCTRDDLTEKIQAELARVRHEWLGNIRKVIEADPGQSVVVTRVNQSDEIGTVRITDDPSAPLARLERLSDSFPHRQGDVIREVNETLELKTPINTHDMQAIKYFEKITPDNSPHYIHKPHEKASPQYTDKFIELICQKWTADNNYFSKCRLYFKEKKH